LAKILNLAPHTLKQPQSPTFQFVVQDGGVPRFHFLVAVLTFSGVMVAAIVHPAVYITVFFCDEKTSTLAVRLERPIPPWVLPPYC
jgi:hypothetical protein